MGGGGRREDRGEGMGEGNEELDLSSNETLLSSVDFCLQRNTAINGGFGHTCASSYDSSCVSSCASSWIFVYNGTLLLFRVLLHVLPAGSVSDS